MEKANLERHLVAYYKALKRMPCTVCGRPSDPFNRTEVDHIHPPSLKGDWLAPRTHKGPGAYWCLPLCRSCHRERHRYREDEWYESRGFSRQRLESLVLSLWRELLPSEVLEELEGLYSERLLLEIEETTSG